MHEQEKLLRETYETSIWGHQYPIKFYVNPFGYTYNCTTCKQAAIYRLEIYNHLYEPQGSEYYCRSHVPEPTALSSE